MNLIACNCMEVFLNTLQQNFISAGLEYCYEGCVIIFDDLLY